MTAYSFTPQPVFAKHGYLKVDPPRRPFQIEMTGGDKNSSGSGFPILPLILGVGVITGLAFIRSKKKGINKKQYVQNKVSQAKKLFYSATKNTGANEQIKKAVDKFKASNPDKASTASYTQTCITGDFIAIKNMEGQLLTEIPLQKSAS